jgi:hypothetical protein
MTANTLLLLIFSLVAIALGVVVIRRLMAAAAVTRTLAPEVVSLRWQAAAMAAEITHRHRTGQAFDVDFFRAWRLSEPQLFPAVGADIGLLSNDAINRLGHFHGQLAAARERLALAASEGGFRPTPYRMLSALLGAASGVRPWLKPHMDILAHTTPDLTDAAALLEELEDPKRGPIAVAYLWHDTCVRPD